MVHGTHGASYISVLNLGMPTSMVLFKWDGSDGKGGDDHSHLREDEALHCQFFSRKIS